MLDKYAERRYNKVTTNKTTSKTNREGNPEKEVQSKGQVSKVSLQ